MQPQMNNLSNNFCTVWTKPFFIQLSVAVSYRLADKKKNFCFQILPCFLIASDEMKRRMYSCILLVGGGAKFEGLSTWLHNRLLLQIPFQFRPEQTEIIVGPKEMDPSMVAWKGAAIMSCLESAQELWIRPAEWKKIGVRLLRERAPFYW
jgi:actin-related protein